MTIGPFSGDYRFLSNFWVRHPFVVDEIVYPSNEHFFQSRKPVEETWQQYIRDLPTAAGAKQAGNVKNAWTLQPSWNTYLADQTMLTGLYAKFSQHEDLAYQLLLTGQEDLVEINTWGDVRWGMIQTANGHLVGENKLGKFLMMVRSTLALGVKLGDRRIA